MHRIRSYRGIRLALFSLTLLVPLTSCSLVSKSRVAQRSWNYPAAARVNQIDDFHGTKVADPYRWLESSDSPETRAWIEAENRITFDYLEHIPARARLNQRVTKLWNYEKYGLPYEKGGRYFYSKNDGLQNQNVLYTVPTLDSQPSVLLDPNKLSADGTVALKGYAISEDGNLMAYGLSSAGSDWEEWKVRDIRTGGDLTDHLKWIKFAGAAWTHDLKGFFYSRFNEPRPDTKLEDVNYYHKLYYHRLGTPQADDVLIYDRPDQKEWDFGGSVTEDGRYLIIHISKGTDELNMLSYKDLTAPEALQTKRGEAYPGVVELISTFEAEYSFVGNDGPVFWFKTNRDAPKGKVIAIDTRAPSRENWKEIIPQQAETLRGVSVVNNQFLCSYLKDAHSQVRLFGLDGKFLHEVSLPGLGSAGGFGGERKDTETFYSFESFNLPPTIYRYDLTTNQATVYRSPKVDMNPTDYEIKQVFYAGKDGTRIPMFIAHKKGLVLNGQNPTLLYGYGGFNAAMTPSFSVTNLVWMELGGVYAMPNLRGGGEYGKAWHDAGRRFNKQNVFDDFVAAAEWLIANKYTNSSKLAIAGGSNGGLLVGACLTQRPNLFGAAIPAVGVMDMLRFHKFTIGYAWVDDYGSPDNPEDFRALYAYSPLHNVKPGTHYPPTLITTADHDDRVVPGHSFKFAAAMQNAQAGDEPILIRIDTKSGHGAGKPTTKRIEEAADRLAFLIRELDIASSDTTGP